MSYLQNKVEKMNKEKSNSNRLKPAILCEPFRASKISGQECPSIAIGGVF